MVGREAYGDSAGGDWSPSGLLTVQCQTLGKGRELVVYPIKANEALFINSLIQWEDGKVGNQHNVVERTTCRLRRA